MRITGPVDDFAINNYTTFSNFRMLQNWIDPRPDNLIMMCHNKVRDGQDCMATSFQQRKPLELVIATKHLLCKQTHNLVDRNCYVLFKPLWWELDVLWRTWHFCSESMKAVTALNYGRQSALATNRSNKEGCPRKWYVEKILNWKQIAREVEACIACFPINNWPKLIQVMTWPRIWGCFHFQILLCCLWF